MNEEPPLPPLYEHLRRLDAACSDTSAYEAELRRVIMIDSSLHPPLNTTLANERQEGGYRHTKQFHLELSPSDCTLTSEGRTTDLAPLIDGLMSYQGFKALLSGAGGLDAGDRYVVGGREAPALFPDLELQWQYLLMGVPVFKRSDLDQLVKALLGLKTIIPFKPHPSLRSVVKFSLDPALLSSTGCI